MSALGDRMHVRVLRRTMDLRPLLEQLRREGWSPRRCAEALDLAERFVVRVLNGTAPTYVSPEVRELARVLDERPPVASALHALAVESRGLWAVEWWPLRRRVVAAVVSLDLARTTSPDMWEATQLGMAVHRYRARPLGRSAIPR